MHNPIASNLRLHRYYPPQGPRLGQIGAGELPWGVVVHPGSGLVSNARRGLNLVVAEPLPAFGLGEDFDAMPPWLPSARANVDAALLEIEARNPDASLVLWPHAAGAISDAPSLRTFLRSRGVSAGGRWRFVYDAAALLTLAMRENVEDHLVRWSEVLLTHPDLAAVVVCEHSPMAAVGEGGEGAVIRPGALMEPLLRSLAGLDPSVAIILAGEGTRDEQAQLAAAGLC